MTDEVKQILDSVKVGVLATVNRDRTPLVTPLHFVRFKDSIVWASERGARHSENVFRSGKAEFVVWDDKFRGIYMTAKSATELAEADQEDAKKAYIKKHGDFMLRQEGVQFYTLPIGQLDDNSTTQNSWYFVA